MIDFFFEKKDREDGQNSMDFDIDSEYFTKFIYKKWLPMIDRPVSTLLSNQEMMLLAKRDR